MKEIHLLLANEVKENRLAGHEINQDRIITRKKERDGMYEAMENEYYCLR